MQKLDKGFITGDFDIDRDNLSYLNNFRDMLNKIHDLIKYEDLYQPENGYGLEINPHVTLLGHIDVDNENNRDFVDEKYVFSQTINIVDVLITFSGIDCFINENFSILKFNIVRTEQLINLHNYFNKRINTSSPFNEFKPHCTIAYLKKECNIYDYVNKISNFYINNTNYDIQTVFSSIKYKSPYSYFGYFLDYPYYRFTFRKENFGY